MLQTKRVLESRSFSRPQSHYSSNHQNQNFLAPHTDVEMSDAVVLGEADGTENTKYFTRTIDSKMKGEKGESGANMESKRNYSIKRPRGSFTNLERNRYDSFLTSRSGCRSRISQAI